MDQQKASQKSGVIMSELFDAINDVPVQINIWIRPECQKKQFEVIRQARPSILFIVSDGGRNEEEWAAIRQNRALYENGIDWKCDVHKIYFDTNQGMYQTAIKAYEIIWSMVDYCIFMEDDIVPSLSFFPFCKELLEKYRDDERVNMIAGFNHLNNYERPSADYFFSQQAILWGYATWKRVYEQFYDFHYGKDPYVMDLLNHETRNHETLRKKINAYADHDYYQGHLAFEEYFLEFGTYAYRQLNIIPTRNLCANIGATENSAHFTELQYQPKAIRKIFNSPTYTYEFPLKHPDYFIPDYYYDRKVHEINADNGFINKTKRQIERKYLYIKSGKSITAGAKRIIKRKLSNNKELES